jgi:hypothetical protein
LTCHGAKSERRLKHVLGDLVGIDLLESRVANLFKHHACISTFLSAVNDEEILAVWVSSPRKTKPMKQTLSLRTMHVPNPKQMQYR